MVKAISGRRRRTSEILHASSEGHSILVRALSDPSVLPEHSNGGVGSRALSDNNLSTYLQNRPPVGEVMGTAEMLKEIETDAILANKGSPFTSGTGQLSAACQTPLVDREAINSTASDANTVEHIVCVTTIASLDEAANGRHWNDEMEVMKELDLLLGSVENAMRRNRSDKVPHDSALICEAALPSCAEVSREVLDVSPQKATKPITAELDDKESETLKNLIAEMDKIMDDWVESCRGKYMPMTARLGPDQCTVSSHECEPVFSLLRADRGRECRSTSSSDAPTNFKTAPVKLQTGKSETLVTNGSPVRIGTESASPAAAFEQIFQSAVQCACPRQRSKLVDKLKVKSASIELYDAAGREDRQKLVDLETTLEMLLVSSIDILVAAESTGGASEATDKESGNLKAVIDVLDLVPDDWANSCDKSHVTASSPVSDPDKTQLEPVLCLPAETIDTRVYEEISEPPISTEMGQITAPITAQSGTSEGGTFWNRYRSKAMRIISIIKERYKSATSLRSADEIINMHTCDAYVPTECQRFSSEDHLRSRNSAWRYPQTVSAKAECKNDNDYEPVGPFDPTLERGEPRYMSRV